MISITIWHIHNKLLTIFICFKQFRVSIVLDFYLLNTLRAFLKMKKECKNHILFFSFKKNCYHCTILGFICCYNFGAFCMFNVDHKNFFFFFFYKLRQVGAQGLGLELTLAMVEQLQVKFIGLELNVGFFTLERERERERERWSKFKSLRL